MNGFKMLKFVFTICDTTTFNELHDKCIQNWHSCVNIMTVKCIIIFYSSDVFESYSINFFALK